MDHAAFQEAIAACPDDDTPRLIFADWLEEHGDPRCTFIRLQCALEHIGADDPHRPAFEAEADNLLATHEEEWTAPLRGKAHSWRFRRGFIDWIDADGDTFLDRAGDWFSAFPIRGVCLRLPSRLMPAVAACPQLNRLESLAFRDHFLRDRELRELLASPHLNRLTALDLANHGIETAGVRALTESSLMPRLRLLDLRMNRSVGDQATRALAVASGAAGLQTLNLADTNLTARGVSDLCGSAALKGLRELDLSVNRPRDLLAFIEPIARSPVLHNLTALGLGYHPLGTDDLQRLLAGSAKGFVRLVLKGCGLTASGAAAIAAASSADRLTALDLTGNRIGADGLRALADAPGLASLTVLRAGANDVRDTGVKALAASPHLTRLMVLDLSNNEIGGPGLRALAASPNFVALRELDLSRNYVNLASIEALADSPHLSRLRVLRLNANRIGHDAAAVLAASRHLSHRLQVELQEEPADERRVELLRYDRRA